MLLNTHGTLGPGAGKQSAAQVTPFAPGGPGGLAMPAFWFDSQDLSTLWQDQAGTSQVTTTTQTIQKWDNKGSALPTSVAVAVSDVATATYTDNLTGGNGKGWVDCSETALIHNGSTINLSFTALSGAIVIWNVDNGSKTAALGWLAIGDDAECQGFRSAGKNVFNAGTDHTPSTSLLAAETVHGVVLRSSEAVRTINYNDVVGDLTPGWDGLLPDVGDNIWIGGTDDGGFPHTGAIGEIIIYDTYLSDPDAAILVAYLEARWGITFL